MVFPIPLAIGLGSAAAGLVGGALKKKKKPKRLPTMSPEQQRLYEAGLQAAYGQGGPLADLYAPYDYEQAQDVFQRNVADPALERFREQVIPGISGQFRSGNLGESSYYGDALARGGRDVQRNLDAQMAQYLQQGEEANKSRRMQGVQNLYGQQSFAYQAPQEDPWSSAFSGGMDLIGQYTGNFDPYARASGGAGNQRRQRDPYAYPSYQRQQLPGFSYNPTYGQYGY